MELHNAIALLGLFVLMVPIIIHLHRRRRSRELAWSAMRFLTDSLVTRRRSLTLENLWLLLCRCLIVTLFVLAMARPVIESWVDLRWLLSLALCIAATVCLAIAVVWPGRLMKCWSLLATLLILISAALTFHRTITPLDFGNRTCDLALVVDASLTMSLEEGGRSRLATAIAEAQSLVNRLSGQSTVSIVVAGPIPQVLPGSPFRNLAQASRLLDTLTLHASSSDLAGAIQRARQLVENGLNPNKQIVVLADDQLSAWQGALDAPTARGIPILGRLAKLPKEIDNLVVTHIKVESALPVIHRPVIVEVEVFNSGSITVQGRAVELLLDDQPITGQRIAQLESGSRTVLRFVLPIAAAGQHVISARINEPDLLPQDNRLDHVVSVSEQVAVLVIDGSEAVDPAQHSASYIALALDPHNWRVSNHDDAATHADATTTGKSCVQTQCVDLMRADLLRLEDLSQYAVIMLCDAARLTSTLSSKLADYTRQGGCVWIVPDGQSDLGYFNAWHVNPTGQPLLPGKLAAQIDVRQLTPELADRAGLTLDMKEIHPQSLQAIVQRGEHDLSQLSVTRYWPIEPYAGATVALRFSNGQPLMLEQTVGRGSVLWQSLSLQRADSNLMALASFPVTMHLWIEQLSSQNLPTLNYRASNQLSIQLPDDQVVSPSMLLTIPDGSSRIVYASTTSEGRSVEIGTVTHPGVYHLRSVATDSSGTTACELVFSVQRDVAESDLTVLSPPKLQALADQLGIQWLDTIDHLIVAGRDPATMHELWKYLVYATMWLLAGEAAIARWVGSRRAIPEMAT